MTDTAADIINETFRNGPSENFDNFGEAAISALTAAGLAIVSVETVLALRAALVDGNADEAHRQLDALMLKESQ